MLYCCFQHLINCNGFDSVYLAEMINWILWCQISSPPHTPSPSTHTHSTFLSSLSSSPNLSIPNKYYHKNSEYWDTCKSTTTVLKLEHFGFTIQECSPRDADGMVNSIDPGNWTTPVLGCHC